MLDITLGDTIDFKFSTSVDGTPTTLAGSPVVSAYPDNSLTQLTAGITLTVDFDGVTGLHNVRVVATSGNGYASGSTYQLVITTGTIGGISAVGKVVGAFTIGRGVSSVTGNVAGSVGSVATGGIAAASFAAGAIDAAAIAANAIGASEVADGAIDAGALAADAVDKILDETIGDTTVTFRQALKLMVATLGGKLSGAATTTVTIRNVADDTNVVSATVDADGNRTAVTLTL
jgi:hypothetical protein